MNDRPPVIVVGDPSQRYAAALTAALQDWAAKQPAVPLQVGLLVHCDARGVIAIPDGPIQRTGRALQAVATTALRILVIHDRRCGRQLLDTGRCACVSPKVVIEDRPATKGARCD